MTALNISKRKIYKRRRDGQVAQGSTVSSVIASTASSGGVDPVALQDYAKKVDVHIASQKAFLDAISMNSGYITYNVLGVSVENADKLGGVVAGSYARKDVANTFNATQTINADLYVNGNIIQNGSAYVTHAEQVQVESNLMQLNVGEPGSQITGVIPGTAIAFSGIEINRGTADPYYMGIVEGANPLIKLGKKTNMVTVAAREDNPTDGYAMQWDATNHRIKSVSAVRDSLMLGGVVAGNYARTDIGETFDGSLTVVGLLKRQTTGATDSYLETANGNNYARFGTGAAGGEYGMFLNLNGSMRFAADVAGSSSMWYSSSKRFETTLSGTKTIGNQDITGYVGSPDYVSGFTGTDWRITKSGFADLDEVNIRKGLTVHELIVARERSVNGGIITSVANGTVKSVAGDVITIKGEYNSWVVGDRVRLQQWEASTRYMEAEVVAVSGMTITLGNYINSTRPLANEDLVQWGHISDISRQNFLYQTARGADAAYFAVMQGVNSSDLTNKQVLRIGNLSGYANAGYGIASKYAGKTYFELSNNVKTIAGIVFDDEKFTAGNVQIWKTGNIINTAAGTPYAFYGNGNFSLGKGQIGYNAVTNVITLGSGVKMTWGQITGTESVETTAGAQAKVDDIKIGGVNIIDGSDRLSNTDLTAQFYVTVSAGIFSLARLISNSRVAAIGVGSGINSKMIVGQEYTISAQFYKDPDVQNPWIWIASSVPTITQELIIPQIYRWTDLSFTFTYQGGITELSFYVYKNNGNESPLYVRNIQLEKGNKATDRKPSLADVDTNVTTITNNTIQTTNVLAQNLQVQMANVTGTLSASQIDALSITGDKIAAGTITTTKLAALTITSEKIASGTITADKLNVTSVQASLITTDYIEGLTLDFDKGTIAAFSINYNYLRGGSTIGGGFAGVELNANPSDEGYIRMYRDGSNTASRVGITFGIESNHDESAIFSSAAYGEYALGLNLVSQENIAIKSGNGVAISAVNEVSLYAGNNKDIILTGNALFKKQIKTLVLQSAGSTSSTYPTTLNTSDSSTFMLGSTSSNRHYSLTGGTNGQLLILFNRNNTSNCYVRGFIQQSANPSDYFEMVGGEVLVAQYHANSMYNPTRTGYWVVLTRYDNSW